MKTLQQTLLGVVASCFYAPSLLPESFIHDGKVYNVSYERADDDSMIKITAWDPETTKDIASLEIR